ncbi:MAG: ATP-binding protein [Candidatus Riflebacteria bacterium]|nr:ATP-binding protein [Candidatus Riflebacteria bacterium]
MNPEDKKSSLASWVLSFGSLILLCSWVITAVIIHQDQKLELVRAAKTTRNLSSVLEKHISGIISQIENSLTSLRNQWESGISTEAMRNLLNHLVICRPDFFNLVSIIDADGNVVVTNQKDFKPTFSGDRPFFLYHQTNPDEKMLIGGPILGRVTGKWYLPVSMRLTDKQKSFAGVILASINPNYFSKIFRDVDLGPDSLIYLADHNGIVYSGISGGKDLELDVVIPKSKLAGIFNQSVSPEDNGSSFPDEIKRIRSRFFIRNRMMAISVETGYDNWLQQSRSRAIYLIGLQMLLSIFIFIVVFRLRQAIILREATSNELDHYFSSALDLLCIADKGGRFVKVNREWKNTLGYTAEDLENHTIFDFVHPDDMQLSLDAFNRSSSQETGFNLINRYRCKDGSYRWIEWRSSAHGQQIYAAARDITDQKIAEEERLKLQKLESIGTLAGGIAHDFNNLLMALFGNLELTKMRLPEDHPAAKTLADAEKAMERATRLTNQLLTFARGWEPVRQIVNIGELIQEGVKFDLSGRNVQAVFDLPGDLWYADIDKGQIQQVISNLVINSVQAMPEGGKIEVKLANSSLKTGEIANLKAGNYVKITFKDEGAGIPPENISRVFDPYFTTKKAGSGLGLATTHSIISKHDGFIGLESSTITGTIFTIFLPAASRECVLNPVAKNNSDNEVKTSGHILVLDDEEALRTLLTKILQKMGHRVETVAEGAEAVKLYQQAGKIGEPFDIVIMDLTIPGGMGGKEAVKEILKIDPAAKCIVSSGYSTDPVMANPLQYGFKGVVEKPYAQARLKELLQSLLVN